MVSRQGFGRPGDFGPAAPTTIKALLDMLAKHRRRGFCILQNCYAPGMSSMAAPVQRRGEPATAAIVVAGPSIRMTGQRMLELGGDLMSVAAELALLGGASPLLSARSKGTWGNRGTGVLRTPAALADICRLTRLPRHASVVSPPCKAGVVRQSALA